MSQDQPPPVTRSAIDPYERPRASGTGRFIASPDTAERDAEACRLRTRGMSLAEIAKVLGYAGPSGAGHAVNRAMQAIRAAPAEDRRALELIQLDQMWEVVLGVLERKHLTVSAKGAVVHYDGSPVEDDGPVLQAIDRLIKIQDRRAKLLGLDAPAKHEVRNIDDFDASIRGLVEQLGKRARERTVD